ncbi:MAG TPA: diphthamide biosynthesis enzyme Dph2 [Candidatus Nanoarchaeia archaeon]|nr:diphthamide biosynthesis enzyme Dph2 [Candidatus Nanoarchaeia archaeon]
MKSKFDFDLERLSKEINEKKSKKVLIQLPEGMKMYAGEIITVLNNYTKCETIVSGESNWGGCDIALDEARNLKVDLLIHFGHTQFVKADFPIIYVEVKDNTELTPLLRQSLSEIKKCKKIGLISSIQHIHKLEETKKFYEENEKYVTIPAKKGFSAYDGHIVGCEYNSLKLVEKEVDAFIVIGNQFHSLGAALSVNKPVVLIDTYNMEVVDMKKLKDKVAKQRAVAIDKIKKSRNIGIIVGTKPGQKFGTYEAIQKKLENLGKNVSILTMSEVTQEKLTNFYGIEGFIELACPRIAIEDYGKYNKPIITFRESLVVLNEMKWEDLIEKGFL